MTWRTHAIIGANAAWVASFVPGANADIVLLAAGTLGGLLPDIDAGAAKIHFLGGGAFGVFRGMFQHRGFFHSLFAAAILFILAFFFLTQYHTLVPFALTLGYVSHLLIDACNYGGVPFFFPLQWKVHLLPRFLRTSVKGAADQLFFVAGLAGILFLLFHVYGEGTLGMSPFF